MSYYLAETYSPKPAWQALSAAQKQAFFEQIGTGLPALLGLGIVPLAFCATDGTKPHAGPRRSLLSGVARMMRHWMC